MLNPLLQSHFVFIPIQTLVIIWDFGLRILDLWHRYALSFIIKLTEYLKSKL
jgi:hypothetical protein